MHLEISLDEKKSLARQFLPTLRFDKREPYTPTNFIELFWKETGEIDFTCSKPRGHWKEKAEFDEGTTLIWFKPTVYIHFLEKEPIQIHRKTLAIPLIIQYWYYYVFNASYFGDLEVTFLEHPHDWEWIQVAVTKSEGGEYKLASYSVSAHGTTVEISDKKRLEIYEQEGFRITRGSHNFASIFQVINQNRPRDIVIAPETKVPLPNRGQSPFVDTLVFLDSEYTEDFLAKFSFFPLMAPWERDLYKKAKWVPDYWSLSVFRRFLELSRGVDNYYYQRSVHKKT